MAREEENNNSRDRSTFWIVEERGNASSADRTSREGRVEDRRREESRKGRGETERETKNSRRSNFHADESGKERARGGGSFERTDKMFVAISVVTTRQRGSREFN